MLREHQGQRRLEMRDEHDTLRFGLRDVPVAARDALDSDACGVCLERRPRRLADGLELLGGAGAEETCARGDRIGDAVAGLDGIEGEEEPERRARVTPVVPLLCEQPGGRRSIATRRGLDVVDAREGAPRPRVATEKV
jgi:hypothetical protein